MKVGCSLTTLNQTTVIQMAHHILPMTKEISDCKVKLARHAFAFCDSACIIHHESMPGGTSVNVADCVEVLSRLLHKGQKKDYQKNGIMDGSCTTTMPGVAWLWQCSSSWWKNQMHSFCSHCICQTLHPVTFCHSLY